MTLPLRNPREEAFAVALADGETPLEASRLAGYRKLRRPAAEARAARPDIARRTADLALEKDWGQTLGPLGLRAIYAELMGAAKKATDLNTASSLLAARALLAEAAKLRLIAANGLKEAEVEAREGEDGFDWSPPSFSAPAP